MTMVLLLLIGGLLILAIVPTARYLDSRAWRSNLMALELSLPARLTVDDATNWLSNIAAITHAPKYSLLPLPPVGFELVASSQRTRFFILVTKRASAKTLAGIRFALPGVRIEEAPDYLAMQPAYRVAAELGMTNDQRPLATERAAFTIGSLLSTLHPVPNGSEIHVQWWLVSGGTPRPIPSTGNGSQSSWPVGQGFLQDSEAIRAARMKQATPLLQATCRVGIVAPSRAAAYALLGRLWPVFHTMNAPGVRLVRRYLPSSLVVERMRNRAMPVIRWPLLLGSSEIAGLLGIPVGEAYLPGLALGAARQLPPAPHMPRAGQIIATSNYPSTFGQSLALTAEDRTRHTYCVGPSGSGKTVLLTRMILSDIVARYGVFACDPKGGLIQDVLARLNNEAAERVVILDPSRRDRPVGLNIIGGAHDEAERELVVDNVLHIFRSIWADSWGPRSDAVLRTALISLVHARAVDQSAMTICEIVPLLTNSRFRQYVMQQAALPPHAREYWQRFNRMSENEMTQVTAPIINKIEAFTDRTSIRLMLGQSQGIDFEDIFRKRLVVLVNLASGDLGEETANLLSSLVLAELWRAARTRVRVAPEKRRPVFAYIDEAQSIVKLPIAMESMLAQARGFKLGLCLANQYVAQLPESMRAAVLGTVKTQITFAVEPEDARLLATRFAPLTADDLMGLPAFELAMRPCVGAQTLSPVTGVSMPLGEVQADAAAIATRSRVRYGLPRTTVEQQLSSRVQAVPRQASRFGQEEAV